MHRGTAATGAADDGIGRPGAVSQETVQRGVATLDGIVQDDLAATMVPGVAVGVVYQGRILYAKGFGVREVGKPEAVDADTVFQLASVSKAISSTVIAAAAQDGKPAWTDPVRKYLPDFTLSDPWVSDHVTIADVLAHGSGLPDHAGDLLEDLGYDQAAILARLRLEPLAPFRAHYAYTNYGLTAGGLAAAAASGKAWPDLARETVFGPLGMAPSSSSARTAPPCTPRPTGRSRRTATSTPRATRPRVGRARRSTTSPSG